HHKKHRPSDIYYIRKAVPTIAKPCKSRALSTICSRYGCICCFYYGDELRTDHFTVTVFEKR
ncbi:MAG: hypothetical protein MR381_08150, partial [Dorea sp.]|nr:hypothetical protein [Dorea sp.]